MRMEGESMKKTRQPAVAGMFYPDKPEVLRRMTEQYLAEARPSGPVPRAMIAPHAGYPYSGPVAASAYARLKPAAETIREVVLFGPSHRVLFGGVALSSAEAYATPLGSVPLTHAPAQSLAGLSQVGILDEAHRPEHSLEVHLPFLQIVLKSFDLFPVVIGDTTPAAVAEVIRRLWAGPERLFIISSDLSHYLPYEQAVETDRQTTAAIENLDAEGIEEEQACGRIGICGMLMVAREKNLKVETVDLRNSGDTAGPRDQVVGYGSYVFT